MGLQFSSREIIRVLGHFGFVYISQKGSHTKFRKHTIAGVKTVIVPHPKKDIPFGTFQSIKRQAGLSEQDFVEHS